jgi:small conductance mechanosensitive channel
MIEYFLSALPGLIIPLAMGALILSVLCVFDWLLLHRNSNLGEEQRSPRRVLLGVLCLLGCVGMILVLPAPIETRSQLIGLLGLLLTVAVTLASTTFIANVMAGLMLRAVRSFRSGDFIQVGEQFGRVTERGLFHTEIQTEDRDLTTLPNIYLVQNPVKVIRYSGTVVSAKVSLGYDVPHPQVISLLREAARNADLQDPFVEIVDLGDFSIIYRVAGVLTQVKQLLTVRSNLRAMVLEALHGAGVEIVSPHYMNQRQLRDQDRAMPPRSADVTTAGEVQVPAERIFDKADQAEGFEKLRLEHARVEAEIVQLEKQLKESNETSRPDLEQKRARQQWQLEKIAAELQAAENAAEDAN